MERKAKIIATLGPASREESVIESLILRGMNVARLNFSHGTQAEHAARTLSLRRISERLSTPVAILQDLQGPKIRVGKLSAPVTLTAGQTVVLKGESGRMRDEKDAPGISILIGFPGLFDVVAEGSCILLDDGRIELTVLETGDDWAAARVKTGGILSSHKGINLPGLRLDIPGFTDKDAADLAFGLSLGVDAVAISFVRSAGDVLRVRQAIQKAALTTPPVLIAKLEKPEALADLAAILAAADGVMVARGDLGVEMPPEDVPVAQKRIIQSANQCGKIVITATQMLDSMIHNPLPTRAEASDVANAVFDGTDMLMLSGETAVGEYPLESVAMMDRIVRQAEVNFIAWGHVPDVESAGRDDAASLARAARELAHDRDVAAIAVFTRSGRTAALMAKARPCVPIMAFTPEEATYRRMALFWGVMPRIIPFVDTVEGMIFHVEAALKSSGTVQAGQQVVVISGFPVGEMRPPNMALLHTVC